MIAKKNAKYDLEKNRLAYLQIGLLIGGGILLTAFTWRKPLEFTENFGHQKSMSEIPVELIAPEEKQEKEPQEIEVIEPVVTQPSLQLNIIPEDPLLAQNKNQDLKTGVSVTDPSGDITVGVIGDISIGEAPVLDEVVKYPSKEAEFVGGVTQLKTYLRNHTEYPELPLELGVQGKIYVQFVVEKDGSVTNVKVLNKTDKDLDREAKRVVKSFPKWIPGEVNGEKCRTLVQQPIHFKIK